MLRLERCESSSGSSAGYWRVAGYEPLLLWRSDSGWRVVVESSQSPGSILHGEGPIAREIILESDPCNGWAWCWVSDLGLDRQRFALRRDLIHAVELALRVTPLSKAR